MSDFATSAALITLGSVLGGAFSIAVPYVQRRFAAVDFVRDASQRRAEEERQEKRKLRIQRVQPIYAFMQTVQEHAFLESFDHNAPNTLISMRPQIDELMKAAGVGRDIAEEVISEDLRSLRGDGDKFETGRAVMKALVGALSVSPSEEITATIIQISLGVTNPLGMTGRLRALSDLLDEFCVKV